MITQKDIEYYKKAGLYGRIECEHNVDIEEGEVYLDNRGLFWICRIDDGIVSIERVDDFSCVGELLENEGKFCFNLYELQISVVAAGSYPDFCDSYIEEAVYEGRALNDDELDFVTELLEDEIPTMAYERSF